MCIAQRIDCGVECSWINPWCLLGDTNGRKQLAPGGANSELNVVYMALELSDCIVDAFDWAENEDIISLLLMPSRIGPGLCSHLLDMYCRSRYRQQALDRRYMSRHLRRPRRCIPSPNQDQYVEIQEIQFSARSIVVLSNCILILVRSHFAYNKTMCSLSIHPSCTRVISRPARRRLVYCALGWPASPFQCTAPHGRGCLDWVWCSLC